MSMKDRLIQFVLRGKDELSPEAKKSAEALEQLKNEATRLGKALDDAKGAQGLAKGLENTRRAAEQSERSLVQADLQIKELRDALNKNPEGAGLAQSLKDAEREGRRLQRQLDGLNTELAKQEKSARDAGVNTDQLGDEHTRLAAEVSKAGDAVKANAADLKTLEREQARAARGATEHRSRVEAARESMSRGAKQALAFAAAYVSLSAAFGLAQKGLNKVRDGIYAMLATGDEFAKLDKRMASLMGSMQAGEQATAWIKQFAKDTPLELREVTEAFALMKSYGLDPMDGSLQAIVDKNEQMGGGMERLSGLASALGQAYAKQKLQTEEILQLVERGVPVWQMLEKVTGKNAAQLQELASKGRLGRDVIAALISEIGNSAKGAAAANMTELSGLVSTLSDTWTDFLNRIAKSGALDSAKEKLKGVADYIDQMDKDGRLDRLAKSLSDVFERGLESASKYVEKLADVDLEALAAKAASAAGKIGSFIEQTVSAATATKSALTLVWNTFAGTVTATAAALTFTVQQTVGRLGLAFGQLADLLGSSELRAKADAFYDFLGDLSTRYAKQAETDFKQAVDAFADQQIAAAKRVADESKRAIQGASDDIGRFFRSNITTIEQALAAISFAETTAELAEVEEGIVNAQLTTEELAKALQALEQKTGFVSIAAESRQAATETERLRGEQVKLREEYFAGTKTLEEWQQGHNVAAAALRELEGAANGAAGPVSKLDDALGDLKSVQDAISNAKTDVDINNIRAALRKLYAEGKIGSDEYNKAMAATAARQKELKGAVEQGAKAQRDKNAADKEAIVTSEQLRRESGKRMEAERKAGDEAMQRRRKESSDAQRDMSAVEGFFSGVVTRAREPLAALSQAALDAYDRLRGLKSADLSIDTSSLESTVDSLRKVSDQLGQVQKAISNPMTSSLGRWAAQMQQDSLKTQQAHLGQKAALQSLLADYESGSLTAAKFSASARGMRQAMSLLDDADLSSLEASIASAEQRMKALADSTRSTLDSLRDELDQLEGRESDIEARKFATRRRELEAQLAEATASGDTAAMSNASRAIGMLRQVQAASEQAAQRAAIEKRMADSQKANEAQAPTSAAEPAKVIRLELAGKSVDVSVAGSAEETALLDLLESAALRSSR